MKQKTTTWRSFFCPLNVYTFLLLKQTKDFKTKSFWCLAFSLFLTFLYLTLNFLCSASFFSERTWTFPVSSWAFKIYKKHVKKTIEIQNVYQISKKKLSEFIFLGSRKRLLEDSTLDLVVLFWQIWGIFLCFSLFRFISSILHFSFLQFFPICLSLTPPPLSFRLLASILARRSTTHSADSLLTLPFVVLLLLLLIFPWLLWVPLSQLLKPRDAAHLTQRRLSPSLRCRHHSS